MTPSWLERLPPGYVAEPAAGGTLVAREPALAAARRMVATAGSLHGYAARHAQRTALRGRGAAYRVAVPGAEPAPQQWVVRHYYRGGAAARALGDRYLRAGTPRPVRELLACTAARARGVPTPLVEALHFVPAGAFYRADIATTWIGGARDLAALTFGAVGSDDALAAAWRAAGALLRHTFDGGIVHADLNLMNVLVVESASPPHALLLDLDRARVVDRVSDDARRRMLARFHRSRRKLERGYRRGPGGAVLAAFEEALGG